MTTALMDVYRRCDLAFERGEGPYLFTEDGRRFLDFASGIAVNSLGHSHPRLVAALQAQAAKLWHCSNIFRIPGQDRVASQLVAHSFADRVFFCNSGAEACEGAIKLARKYQSFNGAPERYRIIGAELAFHGRTLATMAAGGQAKTLEGFGPPVEGFDHVAFGNLNEARAAVTPETAAIMVEPVQGEGGINVARKEYLQGLRAICDEFGLLLIFDEVQTGMGRTGRLFAYEWFDVAPDVMTLAKGLGGGFPVGAVLATDRAAAAMTPGSHGSTFGGNPLAMAAAEAVLEVMTEAGFLDGVRHTAAYLADRLEAFPGRFPGIFKARRGLGMLQGLVCLPSNREMVDEIRAKGLLTAAAGADVVRFAPPLIVTEAHIDEAMDMLEQACRAHEAKG